MEISLLKSILSLEGKQAHDAGLLSSEKRIDAFGDSWKRTGKALESVGKTFAVALTAPLILAGKKLIDVGSDFESAFAGVRKTVNATEPQLARMRDQFRDLAKEIPITAVELAKVGEAAGQLGIETENIVSFTRVMADLGVTTNLSSDQAATALARLANITGMSQENFDRLGSTIVALGNAGASTESEIVEMGLRIAGAGKQAGLSEADILSFANALSSVGIEAEAGGSAISRAFTTMNDAVKLGGKELQVFAKVAGQSVGDFRKSFQEDAAGAMISFIDGLGRMTDQGKSLTPVLDELGLADLRVRDALARAASANDLFSESLAIGRKAWEENTALSKEAAERYKTFDSQVTILGNQIKDVLITAFDALKPVLIDALQFVKGAIEGFSKLDEGTIKFGVTVAAVFAAAGPVVLAIGKLMQLSKEGAIVTAVIAGVAAIAGAYATNFGQMKDTIDAFVGHLATSMATHNEQVDGASVSWKNFAILLTSLGDRILAIVNTIVGGVVTGVKQLWFAFTFQWESLAQEQMKWDKQFNDIWDGFSKRQEARTKEWAKNAVLADPEKAAIAESWKKAGVESERAYQLAMQNIPVTVDTLAGELGKKTTDIAGNAFTGWKVVGENSWKAYAENLRKCSVTTGEVLDSIGNKVESKTPAITANWRELGRKMTQSYKVEGLGIKSPSEIEEITADVLDKTAGVVNAGTPKVAAGMTKLGKGMTRAFLDEFGSGSEGFSNAVEVVIANLGNPQLFEPVSKKVKEGMKKIIDAFKEVAPAVQSFLDAMGQSVKVTEERLAGLGKGGEGLVRAAEAFQKIKKAIEDLNFERAAKGLELLDESIKLVGKTYTLAYETFRNLSARLIADTEALGYKFKVTFPAMSLELEKFADTACDAMADVGKAFEPAADKIKEWIDRIDITDAMKDVIDVMKFAASESQKAFDKLATSPAHWAGETVKAAERVRQALENDFELTITRAKLSQKQSIDSMISDFERLAEQTGLTGQRFKAEVEGKIRDTLKATGEFSQQQIDKIVEQWKQGLEKLPGVWETVFGKLPSSVKGPMNDLFKIIDTMPGKWGDALRKTQSELEKWMSFIDNIFGLIHRLFKSFPESISDVIGKTVGIIKNVGFNLKNTAADIGDVMQFASDSAKQGFNALAESAESGSSRTQVAIQGIAQAVGMLGQIIGGRAGSVLSGAAAGAQIGTMILPGIGTVIGAIGGAIAGLFGGGKSAHQKEMERQQEEQGRLQIQRLKQDLQKGAQEVVQAALQTMRDAMETLERLADYTSVGQKHIKSFFKDLEKVLKLFFDLSTKWGSDLLDKAKAFAERMGPVVEMVGLAVQSLSLLGSYLPVAETIIVEFFHDLGFVIDKFGELADEIDRKVLKHAKRLAKRLGPIAEILGPFIEGFSDLFKFKAVPQSAIDAFADSLGAALLKIGQLADEIDRKMMKDAKLFAERAAAVVALVGAGVEAFIKMVDLKPVTTEAFDALFDGFKSAINRMTELVSTLDVEMLARAEAVAAKSLAIFEAIKAAVETFNLLRDYSSIPAEAFDHLVNDFREAIRALDLMIDFTDELQSKADIWRDAMLGVRATFEEGIAALRDVVRFASAALEGITQELARGGGTTLGTDAAMFRGGDFAVMHRYEGSPSAGAAASAPVIVEDRSIHIGDLKIEGDSQEARDLSDALDRLLRLKQAAYST